jgi:hypothetical protein
MRFPTEVLFKAFKGSGMLEAAVYQPASGSPVPFDVQWVRPEQLLLGDQVQSTEYEIEFETASVPRIAKGVPIQVGATLYRARAPAQTQGDGYFSRCALEKP